MFVAWNRDLMYNPLDRCLLAVVVFLGFRDLKNGPARHTSPVYSPTCRPATGPFELAGGPAHDLEESIEIYIK